MKDVDLRCVTVIDWNLRHVFSPLTINIGLSEFLSIRRLSQLSQADTSYSEKKDEPLTNCKSISSTCNRRWTHLFVIRLCVSHSNTPSTSTLNCIVCSINRINKDIWLCKHNKMHIFFSFNESYNCKEKWHHMRNIIIKIAVKWSSL